MNSTSLSTSAVLRIAQRRAMRLCEAWRIPTFLRWWQAQLLGCLPLSWQPFFRRGDGIACIHWSPELAQPPTDVALPSLPDGARCVLLLPPEQVLMRPVSLPKAVADDFEAAVAYELDRLTPFLPDQVYFAVSRPAPDGNDVLTANLAVIPRVRLDPVLQQLSARGLRVQMVDVLGSGGEPLRMNLLPAAFRDRGGAPRQRIVQALVVFNLALLLGLMLGWVQFKASSLERMRDEVVALRKQAQQVQTLRSRIAAAQDALAFLTEQRQASRSAAGLLSELSQCVPADTWLEQLDMNPQGQLSLNGYSPQASRLITRLKGCSALAALQFQGTLQPDPETGKDRFSLIAQLQAKEGEHAPSTQAH
ncbi:MAG: hypothetical protein GAK43_02548 [Stenotrophomonas maltophilia]|nr:MAG: hypothetical protein GAK43_02548 [Stenotrophomonas maltophilia]